MIFLHYTQMNTFDSLLLSVLQRELFRKTQIILTLSVPDKAKINAKRYAELVQTSTCIPGPSAAKRVSHFAA